MLTLTDRYLFDAINPTIHLSPPSLGRQTSSGMAAELQTLEAAAAPASRKRKPKHKKSKNPSKRVKQKASPMAAAKPRQPSKKMKKLFRKRAREYHSDEEDDGDVESEEEMSSGDEEDFDVRDDGSGGSEGDDEKDGRGAQHGITRFVGGCRAFRVAFMKIMKKHLPDDPLGPILSAHKKLVAEKLAEEDAEHKTKGETKKEKQLAAEKGHIKPANFLDAKEKFLIGVATKGVVKLFNAVSKAQNSQIGLNPSKSKDTKVLAKRRKQAFYSELQKTNTQVSNSRNDEKSNETGWAPLRVSYMLTSSKLKDWDKMAEPAAVVGQEHESLESSDE
ncbi:Rrp15p [Musa troglodytarum]|uniref:Rrp15p n=1 Tax=Musa troglodytarum TaxID=320322 RepID=A0A9E7K8J4_9LILI|nr:Rrp15p [Musa troglodytarum]URE08152.1 Rrp15p [Musa troglodytarum]